jgi:hypothetical protein
MIKILFYKIFLTLTIFCIYFLLTAQEIKSAEILLPPKAYSEIQVSSADMMCDYKYEDYEKRWFDFEYPKVILTENENPIIAFIDEKLEKLIFAEVSEGSVNYLKSIPKFGEEEYSWKKWPIIFVKNNKIYVAIKKEKKWYEKTEVRIFLFDRKTKELSLQEDISLLHDSAAFYSKNIYPYKDSYITVAYGDASCWSELGTFLTTGHVVTFRKQYSLLWNNKASQDKQVVDEGCFKEKMSAYSVSDSGVFQSAWIRNTTRQSISLEYDDTVFYAENKTGNKWGKPLKVYPTENTNVSRYIKDLSMTNYKQSTFILWQDLHKGYFFAEVKDGVLKEVKKIHDPQSALSDFPLGGSLEAKITSDDNGNIYCLLSIQYGSRREECQLILKSRINGKWLEDIVINDEVARLPDIKVDKKGIIHIAYIKYPKRYNREELIREEFKPGVKKYEKATCNYVRVSLDEVGKNVQSEETK